VALVLIGIFAFSGSAQAQVKGYVNTDLATGNDDGSDWDNAWRGPDSLQDGLQWVNQGGPLARVLLVAEGTYHCDPTLKWPVNSTDPKAGTFLLQNFASVRGGYLGGGSVDPNAPDGSFNKTVLSGAQNASYHVAVADSVILGALDGFRIIDGNAAGPSPVDQEGGGFVGYDLAFFTLEHCKIKNNAAVSGGGIHYQGAMGDFTIRSCTVAENDAVNGGGMYVKISSAGVELCNVQFIDNGRGTLTQNGGGLYLENEIELTGANCLFYDNTAMNAGAGIFCDPDDEFDGDDNHKWRHLTVAGNRLATASGAGAGIHYAFGHANSLASLDNSIAWGNIGGQDLFVATGMTFTYSYCDIGTSTGGSAGGGNISQDPLYVNAAAGNFRLRDFVLGPPISPCLDAADRNKTGMDFADVDEDGNPSEELPWDLDEGARVIDIASLPGEVDMGAFEGPNAVPPSGQ